MRAQVIVFQHPLYWYSVPGLLKHWFDKVLVRGFAYGERGDALWGKSCFWVVTTGGDDRAFGSHGMHRRPFSDFSPVVEQTALFCGMHWEEPLVVHGAHRVPREDLDAAAVTYRERLLDLIARAEQAGEAEGTELAAPAAPAAQTDHGGGRELETPAPPAAGLASSAAVEREPVEESAS